MSVACAVVKHVCFDLDGTLCNSSTLGLSSTNEAIAFLNPPPRLAVTKEEYHRCTRYNTLDRFMVHLSNTPPPAPPPKDDPELLRVATELTAMFEAKYTALVSPATAGLYPGVREGLDRVLSPTTMSILTNARQDYALAVLKANGLSDLFERTDGADTAGCSKPEPGGLLRIFESFGCTPATALFVGDSISDGQAGVNAGCRTLGVSWGSGTGLEER